MLAYMLAIVAFRTRPSLRRIVTDNISRVLGPETNNGTIDSTARGVLSSTFKNYFDMVRLPRLSRNEMIRQTHVVGLQHLNAAIAKGKGIILFTAHLGNFDTAFQIFGTYHTQMTVVVESIEPPALLEYVSTMRQRFGVNTLPAKSGALKRIMKLLRKGEMLLFALDRDTAGARVQSPFFGQQTSMPAEAVKIAMRTGATIVPVFNSRRPDGSYDVFIEPELDIERNGNGSMEHNMARIARVLEKYIRRFPDQWVVLEPIWNDN
jgi:KDO2-lipid IV(A) lauroyltransferase